VSCPVQLSGGVALSATSRESPLITCLTGKQRARPRLRWAVAHLAMPLALACDAALTSRPFPGLDYAHSTQGGARAFLSLRLRGDLPCCRRDNRPTRISVLEVRHAHHCSRRRVSRSRLVWRSVGVSFSQRAERVFGAALVGSTHSRAGQHGPSTGGRSTAKPGECGRRRRDDLRATGCPVHTLTCVDRLVGDFSGATRVVPLTRLPPQPRTELPVRPWSGHRERPGLRRSEGRAAAALWLPAHLEQGPYRRRPSGSALP
jgi:hypothetical protein